MTITMFEVGGCVRDSLLGLDPKDIDFAVEAESFDVMREHLINEGFEIFREEPHFLTIRARFPRDHSGFASTAADFVLCRSDGDYSDGRRPDNVSIGNLAADLSRRDFTVNAIARGLDGNLIDPHGGQKDIEKRLIRCVGSTKDRLTEDALRALRAIRFSITKDFYIDHEILEALNSAWLPPLVAKVSKERRVEELKKCFKTDVLRTIRFISDDISRDMQEAIFSGGIWLDPVFRKN
jgi:tRNA nucleotidyltransferase (CCA-adding enzyme)